MEQGINPTKSEKTNTLACAFLNISEAYFNWF